MGGARSRAPPRDGRTRDKLFGQRRHVGRPRQPLFSERAGGDSLRRGAVHHALDGRQCARHWRPDQLGTKVVAIGPGSFNGVRVAVATAKAFAFALHKPLVGVSTLEIIAAQQDKWRGPVCSILEAGRSELYAACYLFDERDSNGEITHHIRQLSEYLMLSPQQLVTYISEHLDEWAGVPGKRQVSPIPFCGELSEITRQVISEQMHGKSLFIDNLQSTRRASTLALLAIQRLYEGRIEDPMLLEPLYLRRPSITKSTRKQPLLGQKPNQSSDLNQTEREEGALRH